MDNFYKSLMSNIVFYFPSLKNTAIFHSAVREVVVSNNFQLITFSEDFNSILTMETLHKVTIADAIKLDKK